MLEKNVQNSSFEIQELCDLTTDTAYLKGEAVF